MFISADGNFLWSGTGATIFESTGTQTEREKTSHEAEAERSDDETHHNNEIYFEPNCVLL